MDEFDVVVVGAGPAGAVAARTAARHGARVLLVEEHTKIGRPIQCTGLLSVRGFEESGASPSVIVREITGAFVHAPDGRCLAIGGKGIKAFVIDRDRFDQDLVKKAEEAGVCVRNGVRAVGLKRVDKCASSQVNLQTCELVNCKVVIGADGPHSKIAQFAHLPRPQKMLLGVQAVIPHESKRDDFVEVFVGTQIAPHFFGWAVPASNGYARVGLGLDQWKNTHLYFHRFLKTRCFSEKVIEFQSGVIPIGPAARTVADGVILVGDAAGQAKPTSGGGIYTSIVCAKIAGEVAAKCALNGDTSEQALWEYERRWRSLLERELNFGMQAHKILCKLSDTDLNRLFSLADDPQILETITEHGDIDYPSVLVKQLIKIPSLWRKALPLLPREAATLLKLWS